MISCNNIEFILDLINKSIKENKYSISKYENKDILDILFDLKHAIDSTDITLNLSLNKITNSEELMEKKYE